MLLTGSQQPQTSAEVGSSLAARLRELAFLVGILAVFIEQKYWSVVVFLYILFQLLNSDFGRKCLKTLPRDLR